MSTHHVYLIPGFFGFATFGDLPYFSHVKLLLAERLAAHGIDARIHDAPTWPTASIRRRASTLLDRIRATANGDGPIHLIGHSTGGLDARLLLSPGVRLLDGRDPEPWASRVRSVVGVATPHRGTPTAAWFASALGQQLLGVLSVSTVHLVRLGSMPLSTLLFLAAALSPRGAGSRALNGTIAAQVYELVLRDFSSERRREIETFLRDVHQDRSLLAQLSPEGLDLFSALARPRPGVREGCVVTRARPWRLRTHVRLGAQPSVQASYALYRALAALAADTRQRTVPAVTPTTLAELERAWGDLPDLRANDGMVPTWSQVHGEVVDAVWADHLDIVGHFEQRELAPAHVDWIRSGSRYRMPRFTETWERVAAFLAGEAMQDRPAGAPDRRSAGRPVIRVP